MIASNERLSAAPTGAWAIRQSLEVIGAMIGNNQPLFAANAPRGLWRFNLRTHPSTVQVASSKRLSNAELYRHVPTAEIVKLFDQGLSHRKIGRLLGMGPCSVGHRLRQEGKRRESPRVTPEELKECRMDPAWEARRGFAGRVICRECGEFKAAINANGEHSHLRKHHMTADDYAAKYPGARFVSFATAAAQSARQGRKGNVEHFMEAFATQYLTPQELRECRTDHEWELERRVFDFVACRRCGLKCRTDLTAHARLHGYDGAKDYRAEYPRAPWGPRDYRRKRGKVHYARKKARMQDNRAELERLRAERRPDDWYDKSIDSRIVGTELLSKDYLSNKQLAARLDHSGILKCPYGPTWQIAVDSRAFVVFVSRVRKWLNKPGQEGRPARMSIHK